MLHWFKLLAAAAVAVLVCFGAAVAQKAPADPERLAAARDLMEVTGVSKQLEGMTAAMRQGFAEGAAGDKSGQGAAMTKEFDAALQKFMSYKEEMLNDFAQLYAETFTAAEMKEVADFYRSGTGAKFIRLLPELMQKGSAIGIKYSQEMMQDMGGAPGAAPPAPEGK